MSKNSLWLVATWIGLLAVSMPALARQPAQASGRRGLDRREITRRPSAPPNWNHGWRARIADRLRAAPPEQRREILRRLAQMRARHRGAPGFWAPSGGWMPPRPPLYGRMNERPAWRPSPPRRGPEWGWHGRGLSGRGRELRRRMGPCMRCPRCSVEPEQRLRQPSRGPARPIPPPAAGSPSGGPPPRAEELARRQREIEQHLDARRRELEKVGEELRRRERELRERAEQLEREVRARTDAERRDAERRRGGPRT